MAALIAYTLPAMQLVCYLVTSGNSSNDATNSGNHFTNSVNHFTKSDNDVPDSGNHFTNSATTQPPPQHQPTSLPDGYVAQPDLGFAYKYNSARLTWIQAQNVCLKEGAQLAVIDSRQKMEYFVGQTEAGVKWLLSGIRRLNDDTWINVNTNETIILATDVWREDYPRPNGDCTEFGTNDPPGLINFHCNEKIPFYCQIPILSKST